MKRESDSIEQNQQFEVLAFVENIIHKQIHKCILSNKSVKTIFNVKRGLLFSKQIAGFIDEKELFEKSIYGKLLTSAVDLFSGNISKYIDSYFNAASGFWVCNTYLYELLNPIFNTTKCEQIKTEGKIIKIYHIENIPIIVLESESSLHVNSILYLKNKKEESLKLLLNLLWDHFNKNVILSIVNDKRQLLTQIEEDYKSDSKVFCDIKNYITAYNSKNISRTIVMFGSPGTGKSTMCRQLVEQFNYSCMTIYCDTLSHNSIREFVSEFICNVNCDAVILEDIDHSVGVSNELISLLEKLHKHVKLVLITCNDINRLNSFKALIRPGRIDKFFMVEGLDEAFILSLLGKNKKYIEDVKYFPIAFICEFNNILEAEGEENSQQSLAELYNRAVNNSMYKKDFVPSFLAKKEQKPKQEFKFEEDEFFTIPKS